MASAIVKGTSSNLAKVWARSVLPEPVGPMSIILLFCISTSDRGSFLFFGNELNEILTKQKQTEEYNLAEIEIILENNFNDKEKIEEIKNQINEIGFENTAIKYSTSLSALEGGNLGWFNPQALSNMVLNAVKEMKPGDISEPIFQSETATFIKLLDKRKISFNDINLKKMKNQIISQKRNELLNLFANSYLSKIKNTTQFLYNHFHIGVLNC